MKWNVGAEYDKSLFKKLGQILKALGFKLDESFHGVVGSQDIFNWTLQSDEGQLVIESETYIGLTVEGPDDLVKKVRNGFEK